MCFQVGSNTELVNSFLPLQSSAAGGNFLLTLHLPNKLFCRNHFSFCYPEKDFPSCPKQTSLWDPPHCYKSSWQLHPSAFNPSAFLIGETFEFSVAVGRFTDNFWSELSPQQTENNLIFGGFIAAVCVLLTSSRYKGIKCINLIYRAYTVCVCSVTNKRIMHLFLCI